MSDIIKLKEIYTKNSDEEQMILLLPLPLSLPLSVPLSLPLSLPLLLPLPTSHHFPLPISAPLSLPLCETSRSSSYDSLNSKIQNFSTDLNRNTKEEKELLRDFSNGSIENENDEKVQSFNFCIKIMRLKYKIDGLNFLIIFVFY